MQTFNLGRALRKFFLSAFVIFTFIAYALHEHFVNPDGRANPAAESGLPTPATTGQGIFKDGTFTGPEVDAYYGLVQVQAVIQNGRISRVEFLEYPHDRNTSQRINSIAMPYLQQEAIQVQSANVDIISGATLTSEAFAQSLQSALQSAQN